MNDLEDAGEDERRADSCRIGGPAELSCIVEMVEASLKGGLASSALDATICFEGEVISADFGRLFCRPTSLVDMSRTLRVRVEIEFGDWLERLNTDEVPTGYVGSVQLVESTCPVQVTAILPANMFDSVRSFKGCRIRIDVYGASLLEPTAEMESDSVVGFVERVLFTYSTENGVTR
jgi:hypothetical protein